MPSGSSSWSSGLTDSSAIYQTIGKINRAGTRVLLIEQNANAALRLARRAYVLENGRIVLEGPGAELAKNEAVRRAYLGVGRA